MIWPPRSCRRGRGAYAAPIIGSLTARTGTRCPNRQTFSDLGFRPFDRLALYLFTGEASATAYFACQKIGAVAVPMNFRLAAGELAHILRDSGARLLIYSHDLAAQVMQAREMGVRVSDYMVNAGPDEIPVPGHESYGTLVDERKEGVLGKGVEVSVDNRDRR